MAAAPETAAAAPYESIAVPSVPELLTAVPFPAAPAPKSNHDAIAAHKKAYFGQVAAFFAEKNPSKIEVQNCVEFAMWIFNCLNFTGDISTGELEGSRELAKLVEIANCGDDAKEVRELRKMLISGGEMATPVVRGVPLLLFSLAVIELSQYFETGNIWRLRVLFRHQLCLSHRSHEILVSLATVIDAIAFDPVLGKDPALLVEIANVQSHFSRFEECGTNLYRAVEHAGLKLEESSMIGVRTRYQIAEQAHVQSILNATSGKTFDSITEIDESIRNLPDPKTIQGFAEGHDLFDRPRAHKDQESEGDDLTPLHPVDKAIILALSHNIRNNNPSHGLTGHKIQVYIERLMVDPTPNVYAQRVMQLLVRARLEQRRNRVQERAFLQLQEICDQFYQVVLAGSIHNPHSKDGKIPTMPRCHPSFFYSVAYPSIWELKSEFASWCFEDNLYKTALETYEQIQDWERIIECCTVLDRRKKAESLARDMLAEDPGNPMLLVALGEATREDKYLWEAWEACEHKMAAPMRSLAKLALDREHYDKVVEYFDMAVEINPIFGGDWFSLGFAALKLGNLERAAEAFTRKCQMDPNDCFAWNNLGSVMMRMMKFRPAFNSISQALRNNRRSWRMWYNYFTLGVELLEVSETTHALTIILEIAGRSCALEGKALHNFVENAIRFISGEIDSHPSDKEVEETWIRHLKHGKILDDEGEEEVKKHAAPEDVALLQETVDEGEEDDCGMADVLPLANEVEMPDNFFPEKVAAREAAIAREKKRIADRYVIRVRQLFEKIVDFHVQDCEVWAVYATLLRFLEGPMKAFEMRQKELRTSQTKENWERKDETFARVCQALERMYGDAADAIDGKGADWEGPGAADGTAPEERPAPPPAPVDASGQVFNPMKYTVESIDAVLNMASEHMEENPLYRKLQVLRMKAHKASKKTMKA